MLNEKSLEILRKDDLLWRQLKTIPAFRALLRAVEARFYRQVDLPEPILDVGCGDGHFAQMTFDQKLTVGLDPWWGPLNKAKRSGMYGQVMQGMGHQMPFPDETFASAISNSVLEHIPDIQPVLNEISRVLKPGGKLVITMPSHLFTEKLGGAAVMGPLGLADQYRRFFNFISRHAHTDSAEVWASRLAQAGFVVERWQYYFSTDALRALEVGHVQGLPSAVMHFLTGQWILAPWRSSLQRTEQWVRPFYEEPFPEEGSYVLFIAQKVANGPIEAALPPARPFSKEELERPETAENHEAEELIPLPAFSPVQPSGTETISPRLDPPSAVPEPRPLLSPAILRYASGFLTGSLLIISLISAFIGQSILSSAPPEPSSGLWWYGYSLVALMVAIWQARGIEPIRLPAWRLPRFREIPPKRWLYVAGLFFSWLAQRQVAGPASPSPTLALFFWLAGIGLAFYALYDTSQEEGKPEETPASFRVSRFSLMATLALFVTALLLRFTGLSQHPFILNGTEASIGLDILATQNPFGTGWLTNPTLPYWLMDIPMAIFGRSVFGIRFLSPIIGALTVVTTYWVGKRLWSEEVGLVSAVLLMGSHFHLHYSRLGVTNIWDPLLTLLALGLIGIAWNSQPSTSNMQPFNRSMWLLVGTAVGFNAYLFTSSHLLPLMLVALLGFAVLFDRPTLLRHAPHILLAAALALVIILPQWLYYRNNPMVFMERANSLGILDSHSGWLSAEASRTGLGEGEILRQQIMKSILAFNYSLDTSPSYRPQIPLLTFGPALVFILGLFVSLIHFRQFRYQLLLVWVGVVVIFAGVLLIEPPTSHRLVIVAPALALSGAVGMVEIGRLLLKGMARRPDEAEVTDRNVASFLSRRIPLSDLLLPVLLIAGVLFSLNDIAFYFGRYRTQYTFADRNTEVADAMADYLNGLGPDWTGYFYGPPSMYIGFPTIPFLATDFQTGVNLFDVITPEDKLPVASTANRVFIFLPERMNELEAVEAAYPGGRETAVAGFYANPLFIAYEVSVNSDQ